MDNKIHKLKKRTFADTICTIIIAIATLFISVIELMSYQYTKGHFSECITNGVNGIIVSVIMGLVAAIFVELRIKGKPFSKSIIWLLRIIAVILIFGAYVPDIIASIITNSEITILSTEHLLVVILGVTIGMLSEIFVYGYQLQEDMDSIA
ncbi:MAG: hypothetical protein K2M46_13880 [Lachnospiraceae bacterium]|nr:hypothetical protein [Lachnospiraceae bacterium]